MLKMTAAQWVFFTKPTLDAAPPTTRWTPTRKRKHMLRVGGDQSSIAMRDPKASELPENHGPLLGNFRESTRMCKQFARVNCTNISQPSPFRHFY